MCTRYPICGPTATEAERIANMKMLLKALQEFKDGSADDKFTKIDLIESYSLIPEILNKISQAKVGSEVATSATNLIKAIFDTTIETQCWSISLPLRQLANESDRSKSALSGAAKPVVKELALNLVNEAAKQCPESFRHEIERIIHSVVLLMNDVNKNVRAIARECLQSIIYSCGNADLLTVAEADKRQGANNFVETIIKAIENLKQVDAAVEKLAGCIFVQQVEAPHLAVMTPIFWRGLKSQSEATQRRCCVIIENMCNVVEDPREGRPLFGETMTLVAQRVESMSDPDARDMAQKTLRMLQKLQQTPPREEIDLRTIMKQATAIPTLDGCTNVTTPEPEDTTTFATITFPDDSTELKYLQKMTNILARAHVQDQQAWVQVLAPFIAEVVAVKCMHSVLIAGQIKEIDFVDDDNESPDLYKGSFSLAFGTIGLLREAKLHLKRGKFYAILGPNNCGKSTLMKSIAQEKLEDFPKRDELVTIYVSHDVEVREIEPPSAAWPEGKTNLDLNGIEYCVDTVNVVYNKTPQITIEEAEEALGNVGFKNIGKGVNPDSPADMLRPITDYSGGWKMKMQLACAKLIDADILTLDEPTGQLDTTNIQWMKDWLTSFLAKGGSIMAASTNASFLDEMCTHIICFESRKLKQFKSTPGSVLSDYVKLHPDKEAYFKLTDRFQSFVFPKPGVLEGVKSRGRAVLKMNDVSFKYPVPAVPGKAIETAAKNTVSNITLSVCMASRISVVGRNGAGKSTAIKLLIGELKPDSGSIFRHAGMRLAYVAQHSLKHLKAHLDKTPVNYIVWRFQGNDDRESLENRSKELNVDEEKLRSVDWCIDPKSGSVRKVDIGEKAKTIKPDCVLGRRKNKQRKYEYDTKWMYQPVENNCWVERETLVAMGYEKLAAAEDEKQAAAAGLLQRPLIATEVEKALRDFGIDSESASHNPIHSLSDGQMFRVVLTAAMWLCPHILILDEPTNYLDRDGIGALVSGLESFQGGVVVISHDAEFASTVCPEQKWVMQQGRLREEGCDIEAKVKEQEKTMEAEGDSSENAMGRMPDEITTANGDTIKIVKQLTEKERKKAIKDITKKLKEDEKKKTLTDGERWELEDLLAEHKTHLCP